MASAADSGPPFFTIPSPRVETATTRGTPASVIAAQARPGEVQVIIGDVVYPWVRRHEPEHRVGAGEGAADDGGIVVRSGDDLGLLAHARRQPGRVAYDHADRLAGVQQAVCELVADVPGGSGDDKHGTSMATFTSITSVGYRR